MHSKNLTLLTDLYELTMMQGYYDKQDNPTVIFDVFYRSNPFSSGYAIAAGLEQVIEYVKNLNFSYDDVDYLRSLHIFSEDFLQYLSGYHFTGSIYAIPEGSLIFPKEPILKVVAPIRIMSNGNTINSIFSDVCMKSSIECTEVIPRTHISSSSP